MFLTPSHTALLPLLRLGISLTMLLMPPPHAAELPSTNASILTSIEDSSQNVAVLTTCLEWCRQTLDVAGFLSTCQRVHSFSHPPSIDRPFILFTFPPLPYSPSTPCHFVRRSTRKGSCSESARRPWNHNAAKTKWYVDPRRRRPSLQQQIEFHRSLSSN